MPLTRKTARMTEPHSSREQEEEPKAKRQRLEPVEAQPAGPLPYRDFVEREAREYWQSLGGAGSLTKPAQEEIRAAAMPILCQALRRREGRNDYPDPVMAHHAVGGMLQHALETGRIKPPFSEASESPNYVEALIKLADDANWIAREIPLPEHPPPHHPKIYYTIDSGTNQPIPRDDCYLRGNYVYSPWSRSRITPSNRIFPLLVQEDDPYLTGIILQILGVKASFTLVSGPENVEVVVNWTKMIHGITIHRRMALKDLHFSPYHF